MISRCALIGMILFVVTASGSFAAENSVNGWMKVGGKFFKLTFGKAYRFRSEGKNAVAVILSQKPFELQMPKRMATNHFMFSLNKYIPLLAISVSNKDFDEVRDPIPHIQILYDATTGDVMSYQGWANGTTFQGGAMEVTITTSVNNRDVESHKVLSDTGGTWSAKIKDDRIVGSGKTDPELEKLSNDTEPFDFNFDLPIEKLTLDLGPQNHVEGSMMLKSKVYKLKYARAFRIKSEGKDAVAIIVSRRPVELRRPQQSSVSAVDRDPIRISAFWISGLNGKSAGKSPTPSVADGRSADWVYDQDPVEHFQVVCDATTAKFMSYQACAGGMTSIGSEAVMNRESTDIVDKNAVVEAGTWVAKLDGDRIVGSAKYKSDDRESFDFKFDVAIQGLDVNLGVENKAKDQ